MHVRVGCLSSPSWVTGACHTHTCCMRAECMLNTRIRREAAWLSSKSSAVKPGIQCRAQRTASAGDHRLSQARRAQVAAVPCEWPSPQGLLECGNAAFNKLGSLLTYLATELEGLQRQVRCARSLPARMAPAEAGADPTASLALRQRPAALRGASTACLQLCGPRIASRRSSSAGPADHRMQGDRHAPCAPTSLSWC